MTLPQHIVLTFHCVRKDGSPPPSVFPELHIPERELEELVLQLRERNYRFCWPSEASKFLGSDVRTCSITFDDGYANNLLFLRIAEKYSIPFMVFVASFNISDQKPFIWDYMAHAGEKWDFRSDSYSDLYGGMRPEIVERLMTETYRPMRSDELAKLAASPLVKIGLHSDIHQPFLSERVDFFEEETNRNIEFLNSLSIRTSIQDFAFPNGLFSAAALAWAKLRFERVFTIDPEPRIGKSNVIGRISVIHLPGTRSLMAQVERGYSLRRRAYLWVRKMVGR